MADLIAVRVFIPEISHRAQVIHCIDLDKVVDGTIDVTMTREQLTYLAERILG